MRKGPRLALKAIAKQLGISVTTVSRSLSDKAEECGTSKTTEEAGALHVSPHLLARGCRLNRAPSVGLLVPNTANP